MTSITYLKDLNNLLTKKDIFIREAYNEALKSPMTKNYGAVLIHHNKIISRGHNSYKLNLSSKAPCCLLRG